jgi:hypothetical protein
MIHIAPNGPAVHAEPVGEFGHGPNAARLQELQQGQHAGGNAGRGSSPASTLPRASSPART